MLVVRIPPGVVYQAKWAGAWLSAGVPNQLINLGEMDKIRNYLGVYEGETFKTNTWTIVMEDRNEYGEVAP